MKRHYCTCCNRKRNEDKMKQVWYSLVRKHFWHCLDCLSTAVDISYSGLLNKTKTIEITTIDKSSFSSMSGMYLDIENLVKTYPGEYRITYYFK